MGIFVDTHQHVTVFVVLFKIYTEMRLTLINFPLGIASMGGP